MAGTRFAACGLWLGTSLLLACADTGHGEYLPGSVRVQLSFDESLGVQSVVYALSANALRAEVSGAFEPGHAPPFDWVISNLPPADDYELGIRGYDRDGNELCAGSTEFELLENDSLFLNMQLICGQEVGGPTGQAEVLVTLEFTELQPCPTLHFIEAEPRQIGPAAGAQLDVVASGPEGAPLTYDWAASAGIFDDASSSSARYFCDGASGEQTLSVFIGNGEPSCETVAEVTVPCPQ